MTIDTALRLSALLGTTPQLWLDLQHGYDLYQALNSKEAVQIKKTIQPIATAEGYGAMSSDTSSFAEAALSLASETRPAWPSETPPSAGRPRRPRT